MNLDLLSPLPLHCAPTKGLRYCRVASAAPLTRKTLFFFSPTRRLSVVSSQPAPIQSSPLSLSCLSVPLAHPQPKSGEAKYKTNAPSPTLIPNSGSDGSRLLLCHSVPSRLRAGSDSSPSAQGHPQGHQGTERPAD